MSEWFSVLAIFWALWAVDGLRLLPRRSFTLTAGMIRKRKASRGWARVRVVYSRLSLPGWLPIRWRMTVMDVPLALSPVGICNMPTGAAGRPAEKPSLVKSWRWEEVRQVGLAGGWIFVNGESFCAHTGHLNPAELLSLARSNPAGREKRIEALLRIWFRPAHLRRRAHVLCVRTATPALLNAITFGGLVGLSVYVAGDLAARLPAAWSERLADSVPWLLLGLLGVHFAAVVLAWRAKRMLRGLKPEKRGSALVSALLLPAQGLRLRSILGEGFFPAQHPMAAILAFAGRRDAEAHAFNVIADLRWPHGESENASPAREIAGWFRDRLESRVIEHLDTVGISLESLLAAPQPDSPASESYCPRCRDQFVGQCRVCPNGVMLRPLHPLRGGSGER